MSVEIVTLNIAEPTPFIEVAAHIDDMNPQITQGMIGRLCVMMHNRDRRQEECQVVNMDSASQVQIFRIHEKAFVKEVCSVGGLRTQEHKTAAEVRRVKRTVVAGKTEFVPLGAFSGQKARQEPASNQIPRGRKKFGKVLHGSIGINDLRHDLSDKRILSDEIEQIIDIGSLDLDIGIDNQMERHFVIN